MKRGPAPKPAWRKVGHRNRRTVFLPLEPEQDLEEDDRPDPTGEFLARWANARGRERGKP